MSQTLIQICRNATNRFHVDVAPLFIERFPRLQWFDARDIVARIRVAPVATVTQRKKAVAFHVGQSHEFLRRKLERIRARLFATPGSVQFGAEMIRFEPAVVTILFGQHTPWDLRRSTDIRVARRRFQVFFVQRLRKVIETVILDPKADVKALLAQAAKDAQAALDKLK